MFQVFGPVGAVSSSGSLPEISGISWIDCHHPTREEELAIEKRLGINLPTREEMAEIEDSNRLYEETTPQGMVYTMTATLVGRSDSDIPDAGPVTFILTPKHLITLRYNEYRAFANFSADFNKHLGAHPTADRALTGLIEHIIERLADLLERVNADIEGISSDLFALKLNTKGASKRTEKRTAKRKKSLKPREILNNVGATGNLDAKVRESLVSLQRMVNFLSEKRTQGWTGEARSQLSALRSDIQALCEHSYFLADKITFMLDATLGLINIEQNDIIRIFSIAAVMFMPPTLIASIYGMNFQHMHELHWQYGYEYALVLMLFSTVAPFLFFKKKGWM